MKYRKLNIDWNAEPNAPGVKLQVNENEIKLEFLLNPFAYDNVSEKDKGELIFNDCFKYSFNSCNDEGYFLGQYRYKNDQLPWGEFYELQHDWEKDFHPDFRMLNSQIKKDGLRHFIFFFRDNTFECVAKDFKFSYLRS